MLEDNRTFEIMLHVMELGIVIGMGAVVAYTLSRFKEITRIEDSSRIAADARSDPGRN